MIATENLFLKKVKTSVSDNWKIATFLKIFVFHDFSEKYVQDKTRWKNSRKQFERIISAAKKVSDALPFFLTLYCIVTYSDICFWTSLIPADTDMGTKILLIIIHGALCFWAFGANWTNTVFWVLFDSSVANILASLLKEAT